MVLNFKTPTSHMKNRLEPESESSNFHRIIDFDTVVQHSDACPIFRSEYSIVVGIQGRTLLIRHSGGLIH